MLVACKRGGQKEWWACKLTSVGWVSFPYYKWDPVNLFFPSSSSPSSPPPCCCCWGRRRRCCYLDSLLFDDFLRARSPPSSLALLIFPIKKACLCPQVDGNKIQSTPHIMFCREFHQTFWDPHELLVGTLHSLLFVDLVSPEMIMIIDIKRVCKSMVSLSMSTIYIRSLWL